MAKKLVEFLRAMLFNKVYSSQTINYLFDSQSYASRCKNDALAKGLIKKVDYKKRERTAHTITLFYMTKRGMKYLAQNDSTFSELMSEDDAKNVGIVSNSNRQDSMRFRISRDTVCLTLAQMSGAYVPIENYTILQTDDEDTKPDIMAADEFIAHNLTNELYQTLFLQENADPNISFYISKQIKLFANNGTNEYTDIVSQDYAAGRYSGIITSTRTCSCMERRCSGWHGTIGSLEKKKRYSRNGL